MRDVFQAGLRAAGGAVIGHHVKTAREEATGDSLPHESQTDQPDGRAGGKRLVVGHAFLQFPSVKSGNSTVLDPAATDCMVSGKMALQVAESYTSMGVWVRCRTASTKSLNSK